MAQQNVTYTDWHRIYIVSWFQESAKYAVQLQQRKLLFIVDLFHFIARASPPSITVYVGAIPRLTWSSVSNGAPARELRAKYARPIVDANTNGTPNQTTPPARKPQTPWFIQDLRITQDFWLSPKFLGSVKRLSGLSVTSRIIQAFAISFEFPGLVETGAVPHRLPNSSFTTFMVSYDCMNHSRSSWFVGDFVRNF